VPSSGIPGGAPRRRPARAPDPRLSAEAAEALADTFRVLGDPTRIRLIAAMAVAERCVGDLAATVGMSESAVSHQLRMLRAARLVRTRRAGRHVFYTLDDGHILALFQQGLSHVHEGPVSAPSALRRGEAGEKA
jgi:ArsR family transcriptional regulator, lead/cadmium/zinc/bismuth-responsive transcriptional repressor